MSKKEETPVVTDPVILAAMVEDPDETPEEKAMREEMLGTSETIPGKGTPSSDDDDEEEDEDEDDPKDPKPKDPKDPKAGDDDEEEDEDDEEDDPAKPKPKKPVEAEDDEEDEDEDQDDPDKKKTRKEKRKERQEDFLTSIRKDNVRDPNRRSIPNYQPLQYEQQPVDEEGKPREYKPEELDKDRQMVGAVEFARGANEARFWGEQDRFWTDLTSEAKILAYDPKLSFLSEKTPDGKANPDFDPDKAEEINGLYLQLAGFKQQYRVDANGTPLVDRRTGQPIIVNTVQRTDLSYEKFAKRYVARMEDWASDFADDKVEETRSNTIKQRKNQGIRPGGGKRKTLGALNPGDISRMSDEELEKNEAAIDAQIDAMLGI